MSVVWQRKHYFCSFGFFILFLFLSVKSMASAFVGISAIGSEDWSDEFLIDLDAPPVKNISERPSSDPPKVPEDDPDDMNWDVEFGIDEEVKEAKQVAADGFRLLLCDTDLDQRKVHYDLLDPTRATAYVKSSLPVRCRIVSKIIEGRDEITIKRLPRTTELFSLVDRRKKKKIMSAVEFEDWLSTIVSKRVHDLEKNVKTRDVTWFNKIVNKTTIDCRITKVYGFNIIHSYFSPIKCLVLFRRGAK